MKHQGVYPRSVIIWLVIGLVMVFIQVILGGITRLTESGLSITKWEVVSGTMPPISQKDWQEAFDLYKATPQYREINEGMTFDDFKFIYFWEYIHRFWARIMGFVFLFPFLYFLKKRFLDKAILKNLFRVVLLAILAATFGWIMVASGLIERPWVNAYKLSIHLMIAFAVFAVLEWTFLKSINLNIESLFKESDILNIKLIYFVGIVLVVQVFFGGVLSGMKAAVVFPSWPDMNGSYFPKVIFDTNQWNWDNFNNYDKNELMPALIHFLHRNTAYLLFFSGSYMALQLYRNARNFITKYVGIAFFCSLIFQIILGIITILNSAGNIPVLWGVLHQAGALFIISNMVLIFFILSIKNNKK